MPLLLLPIILIAVGIALILVIGMSLFIGVALIHILFWPVVIGLIVWWVLRRRNGSNRPARHLYERLGFVQLGVIPGGFRRKDGRYENICPYYRVL